LPTTKLVSSYIDRVVNCYNPLTLKQMTEFIALLAMTEIKANITDSLAIKIHNYSVKPKKGFKFKTP